MLNVFHPLSKKIGTNSATSGSPLPLFQLGIRSEELGITVRAMPAKRKKHFLAPSAVEGACNNTDSEYKE